MPVLILVLLILTGTYTSTYTCIYIYIPVAEKTYLFEELCIETIIRNPKKVGLFGYRCALPGSHKAGGASRPKHPNL